MVFETKKQQDKLHQFRIYWQNWK